MYPRSMFLSKNKKTNKKLHLKIIIFTAVKYCSILYRCVFVIKVSDQVRYKPASSATLASDSFEISE